MINGKSVARGPWVIDTEAPMVVEESSVTVMRVSLMSRIHSTS
jgi:hypothetical protein